MRVLLISASTLTEPYPVYPIGLDYVAGALAGAHETEIADMNLLSDEDRDAAVGETVRRFNPDLIGISLRNIDNTDAGDPRGYIGACRSLIDAVRAVSGAPVAVGGSGFTLFPEGLMETLRPDYGVVGEGERLGPLLKALANGGDASGVPGVLVGGAPAPASAPPAPWDGEIVRDFDAGRPHVRYYLDRGGMLNLQTKRGCPFRCVYCTYPHIEGRTLRKFPVSSAVQTALDLQAAGARFLFVTDSVFNAEVSHSLAVAEGFRKGGLSIPWGAFFAPMRPPKDYFKILAGAGLTHAEFGTESMSDRMLRAYNKPYSAEDAFAAHDAALAAGLNAAHFMLLGGPGESADTLNKTLTRLDNLDKTVLFFFSGVRIYPHTGLFDMAVKTGRIRADQNLLDPVFYQPDIPLADIQERVRRWSKGRPNWVLAAGGEDTARIMRRMHQRGRTGPLWEHLVR